IVDSLITIKGELKAPAIAQNDGKIIIAAAGTNGTNIAGNSTINVIDANIDASAKNYGDNAGSVEIYADYVNVSNSDIDVSTHTTVNNNEPLVQIGGDYQGKGPNPNAINTNIDENVNIKADAINNGNGGTVIVWADITTEFSGNISATGGINGGNGGFAEVSGKQNLTYDGFTDLSASNDGYFNGTLLLDPDNIFIVDGNPATDDGEVTGSGIVSLSDGVGSDFYISDDAIEAQLAFTNVILQATQDITVDAAIEYNQNADLSLFAGGSINVNYNIMNNSTTGGDINLVAGWDGISTDIDTIKTTGFLGINDSMFGGTGNDITFTANGNSVAVGSYAGETNILSNNFRLDSIDEYVNVGHIADGSNGDINILLTDNLVLNGGSGTADFAKVGHGLDGVSNASYSGDIYIESLGDQINFINATENWATGKIGHGLRGDSNSYSGDITIVANDINLKGPNSAFRVAHIGHGSVSPADNFNTYNNADITIIAGGELSIESDSNGNSIIGHGPNNHLVQGRITNSDLFISAYAIDGQANNNGATEWFLGSNETFRNYITSTLKNNDATILVGSGDINLNRNIIFDNASNNLTIGSFGDINLSNEITNTIGTNSSGVTLISGWNGSEGLTTPSISSPTASFDISALTTLDNSSQINITDTISINDGSLTLISDNVSSSTAFTGDVVWKANNPVTLNLISGTADLTFAQVDSNDSLDIGSGGSGDVVLTDAIITEIQDSFGSYTFGTTNSGDVNNYFENWDADLNFVTGGNFTNFAAINSGDLITIDAGNDVILNDTITTSSSVADALQISVGSSFINNVDQNVLSVNNSNWVLYTIDPSNDTLNAISADDAFYDVANISGLLGTGKNVIGYFNDIELTNDLDLVSPETEIDDILDNNIDIDTDVTNNITNDAVTIDAININNDLPANIRRVFENIQNDNQILIEQDNEINVVPLFTSYNVLPASDASLSILIDEQNASSDYRYQAGIFQFEQTTNNVIRDESKASDHFGYLLEFDPVLVSKYNLYVAN
ncbi:MAG: hypothetical protein AAF195_02090, partial [Pseudomonadota bacterium]